MNQNRALSSIQKAAGEFIARESNGKSLVTVTRVEAEEYGRHVTVYFSVFPDKDTHAVQDFLARNVGEFAVYLKSRIEIRMIPRIKFLPEPERQAI